METIWIRFYEGYGCAHTIACLGPRQENLRPLQTAVASSDTTPDRVPNDDMSFVCLQRKMMEYAAQSKSTEAAMMKFMTGSNA